MPVSNERQNEVRSKSRDTYNAYMRNYRQKNLLKMRSYDRQRHYGIDQEGYEKLLELQGGVCAICKQPPGVTGTGKNSVGSLAVDHCHELGVIRGLLCTKCNLGIGSFCDNPKLLKAALNYVQMYEDAVNAVRNKKGGDL